MPARPFCVLVEVAWPLPEGLERRFHYFRREKDAVRLIKDLDLDCRVERLPWGPTFQRPVVYATLEHHGLFYEVRREFPYETSADDVNEAFLDKSMLGCDCALSDLIITGSPADEAAQMQRLTCGSTIRLCSKVILWESEPAEFQLH